VNPGWALGFRSEEHLRCRDRELAHLRLGVVHRPLWPVRDRVRHHITDQKHRKRTGCKRSPALTPPFRSQSQACCPRDFAAQAHSTLPTPLRPAGAGTRPQWGRLPYQHGNLCPFTSTYRCIATYMATNPRKNPPRDKQLPDEPVGGSDPISNTAPFDDLERFPFDVNHRSYKEISLARQSDSDG
jgi:hypothetical protein